MIIKIFFSKATKIYPFVLLAMLLISQNTAKAQAFVSAKFGKGIQVVAPDSSFALKFGTRFQTLYDGELNLDNNDYTEKLLIRRARLKFEGFVYDPSLEFKVELGLSNRDIGGGDAKQNNYANNIILDAVLKWNFYKNFELWVGQTKLPGNRERLVSSQKLQFVDRSYLNSYFDLDRDIGLQLTHWGKVDKAIFRESLSVSMGEGRDVTASNAGGHDYTIRGEILPFGAFEGGGEYVGADLAREKSPKLAIGVSYDFNDGASREAGQTGNYLDANRNLSTVFVDGMFKYMGSSFMFEYAHKKAQDGPVVATDIAENVLQSYDTGNGLNLQGGYVFKSNFEIAARYTHVSPEEATQKNNRDEFTLGLSRYIVGHNLKIQSDISLIQETYADDQLRFRLQVEMAL